LLPEKPPFTRDEDTLRVVDAPTRECADADREQKNAGHKPDWIAIQSSQVADHVCSNRSSSSPRIGMPRLRACAPSGVPNFSTVRVAIEIPPNGRGADSPRRGNSVWACGQTVLDLGPTL